MKVVLHIMFRNKISALESRVYEVSLLDKVRVTVANFASVGKPRIKQ